MGSASEECVGLPGSHTRVRGMGANFNFDFPRRNQRGKFTGAKRPRALTANNSAAIVLSPPPSPHIPAMA